MSNDTEIDLKDVELNELDAEKQPMTGEGSPAAETEKNGCVKVKLPEDQEEGLKFTGLSKEELLKVAGTPGWVRTRWALLILFWLGWLGMLAAAIAIIVQAPRCKSVPEQSWWHKGALYRIGAVAAFMDSNGDGTGDLAGVSQRIDELNQLKIKGLVLGPVHKSIPNTDINLDLMAIDPSLGSMENFTRLLQVAQKKSIRVVLDLTPNYKGEKPWFTESYLKTNSEKLKEAFRFWLDQGVDGIQLSGVEELLKLQPQLWEELRNLTGNYSTEERPRILIGETSLQDMDQVLSLQNRSAADLLVSGVLGRLNRTGSAVAAGVEGYLSELRGSWPGWAVGGRVAGHMASLVPQRLLGVYHTLLFTIPGTPVTNYGDEIGLRDEPGQAAKSPRMQWDESGHADYNQNISVKAQKSDPQSLLSLYRSLSDLKGKERSLLYGEFQPLLSSSSSVFSYLRRWDQSERFLVALNFGESPAEVTLQDPLVPPEATVVLSSDPSRQAGVSLGLEKLTLHPSEALLLKFPYVA
ncbi:4F2 cell-surface antigen heavy chain-like [Acipenser ruthenus]|uniref:4F2 cell-surface antigen heavy chain-like n=1 Tax=Acipenser ruthenus TaxID=7906 RepID=UPI0027411B2B|nr:4F2 cell-surface antigen heavy chain-like [Acipenser ruthenus]